MRGFGVARAVANSFSVDLHWSAADLKFMGKEEARVVMLADLITQYGGSSGASAFSSLDGQGPDREVHDGASDLPETIGEIGLELFPVESYAGQALMPAYVSFTSAHVLAFWSLGRGLMDGKIGSLLQCDGTFVRESAIARG